MRKGIFGEGEKAFGRSLGVCAEAPFGGRIFYKSKMIKIKKSGAVQPRFFRFFIIRV